MTLLAWLSDLLSLPLTFAVDTALAIVGGNPLALGLVVWPAGLLFVLLRTEP